MTSFSKDPSRFKLKSRFGSEPDPLGLIPKRKYRLEKSKNKLAIKDTVFLIPPMELGKEIIHKMKAEHFIYPKLMIGPNTFDPSKEKV